MLKLLGIKKLMTQVFNENGNVVPVTVIDLNNLVIAKKFEGKIFFGIGKEKSPSKPDAGNYKDLGYVPAKVIEVETDQFGDSKVGDSVTTECFNDIKCINISGVSKGKGFAGVVKRWGFHGGPKTHGCSDRNRAPGSVGSGTTPGRVYKGKKMGGRMGGDNVTVRNLDIVKIDKVNNYILVKGAVPGARDSIVTITIK